MKARTARVVLTSLIFLTIAADIRAATLRYAIIVGSDTGADADGMEPFPPLRHAEREARELRNSLVELCNFDPATTRTILLLGATRARVKEAFRILREQKQSDLMEIGRADTLFAFFFTGHGQNGRLLLKDGPLSTRELGKLFHSIGAKFNIGLFDACYSGSLDPAVLMEKGIRSAPGINLHKDLPDVVLNTEGSIWFVSSGPNQVSYEDKEIGGVFTHFFIEGLEQAPQEGPGITLERIWDYAREKTCDYTARHGRHQNPQQYIARLKSKGPLHFSFPFERSSRLVLGESTTGHFVLVYAGGHLTERIHKEPGSEKSLAVYPGKARLMLIREGQVYLQEDVTFEDGRTINLNKNLDGLPGVGKGRGRQELWIKGIGEQTLVASVVRPVLSGALGVGYRYQSSPKGSLFPRHIVPVTLVLDRSAWTFGASAGLGMSAEHYPDWGYELRALVVEAQAGYRWDLDSVSIRLGATIGGSVLWESFYSKQERQRFAFHPGAFINVFFPSRGDWSVDLGLRGGIASIPGTDASGGNRWAGWLGLGLSVFMRIF
jgi:hypothetical protein